MAVRAVFFCGDQSPYGRAHLRPVLDCFDVAAVVIATPQRWAMFREALSGEREAQSAGRKAHRRHRARRPADYVDVPEITRERGVDLRCVDDVNDPEFVREIRGMGAEVLICAAYPQIFGGELLSAARRGAVNFHPSALPKFRGAHPHFWAIATGAATGGITAHFMTTELDAGDIVAQVEFPIAELTYSQLYARIREETPAMVRRVADFLAEGSARPRPQDHSQATIYRNDREIHRRIFWTIHDARQVHNLCRTERAFCFFGRSRLVLLDTVACENNRNLTNGVVVESGTIVDTADDGVVVKCRDGCISVGMVMCGGRRYGAGEWAKRWRVRVGEKLS